MSNIDWFLELQKEAKDKLEPTCKGIANTPSLKGKFEDYLTDVDVSSPCERLPDDYQAHLDKDWWYEQNKDEDFIGKFRKECEAIDKGGMK